MISTRHIGARTSIARLGYGLGMGSWGMDEFGIQHSPALLIGAYALRRARAGLWFNYKPVPCLRLSDVARPSIRREEGMRAGARGRVRAGGCARRTMLTHVARVAASQLK